MARIILILILAYIIYRLLRPKKRVEEKGGHVEDGRRGPSIPTEEAMVKDPWCNIYVPSSQSIKLNVNGKALHFCSEECREKYLASIQKKK